MIEEFLFGNNKILLNTNNGKLFYTNTFDEINYPKDFFVDSFFDIMDNSYKYNTINISLNITKQCNLACRYCFNQNKEYKSINLEDSIKFINKIINDFPDANKYLIDLSGSGEPLLEIEKIKKISQYCISKSNEIRKEILPMFVSNGVLLNNDMAIKLQENGILFGFSIDGIKKYHDKYRVFKNGKPSFDIILKNIKTIKNREYVGCAVTLNDKDVDLVKSIKFLNKYFNTISIKISRSINSNFNINDLKEQYTKLTDFIIKEIYNKRINILLSLLNGDDLFGKYISLVLQNNVSNHRCDAGIGKFAIDSDLKVYTCSGAVYSNDLCLGNIDNIDYFKGRIIISNAINNEKCINCNIKKFCGHECLVRLVNGVNDDMCVLKKHLFKLALLLSLVIKNNYGLHQTIIKFLYEKGQRFEGDNEFYKFVNYYKDISFSELKRIKDTDIIKYKEMIKNMN